MLCASAVIWPAFLVTDGAVADLSTYTVHRDGLLDNTKYILGGQQQSFARDLFMEHVGAAVL